MRIRPAFIAAPLLAVLATLGLAGCTPTVKVAEPDIVMKSPVGPKTLSRCLAVKLGENFRDHRPSVDIYRGVHEITIDSPRGEKLAFVTVEPDYAGGSVTRFWNGDLYWPDHTTSGVWPDVARDNWHRFEAAQNACQPKATAAKPLKRAPAPVTPPTASAPFKGELKAKPLKPLAAQAPAQAPSQAPGAPRTLAPQ